MMQSLADADYVASPCVCLCELNADSVCRGCGRHVDEIAAWSQATDREKRAIVERSQERQRKGQAQ